MIAIMTITDTMTEGTRIITIGTTMRIVRGICIGSSDTGRISIGTGHRSASGSVIGLGGMSIRMRCCILIFGKG